MKVDIDSIFFKCKYCDRLVLKSGRHDHMCRKKEYEIQTWDKFEIEIQESLILFFKSQRQEIILVGMSKIDEMKMKIIRKIRGNAEERKERRARLRLIGGGILQKIRDKNDNKSKKKAKKRKAFVSFMIGNSDGEKKQKQKQKQKNAPGSGEGERDYSILRNNRNDKSIMGKPKINLR